MKKTLITIAIASSILASTAQTAYAAGKQSDENSNIPYAGMGIGATAGAVIAGPIGFIAGGIIGGLAEHHNGMTNPEPEPQQLSQKNNDTASDLSVISQDIMTEEPQLTETETLTVAAASNDVIEIYDEKNDISTIISDTFSLDVFFLSGSVSVDPYYNSRIKAVSELMQSVPDIDVYLDGYSDRRGTQQDNIELSNLRLESVRDLFIQSGVEPSRIHTHAYGEKSFISAVGNLEAYTFDRRVVIRFGISESERSNPVALHLNITGQ